VPDAAGVLETDLTVCCQGFADAVLFGGLTSRIGKSRSVAGLLFPSDAVVADDNVATLIPDALLVVVLAAVSQQEQLENWIMHEMKKGVPLPGLYPSNNETKAWYELAQGVGH
jgi:hypothetical protein